MDKEIRQDKANQAALDFLEIIQAHDLSPPEAAMAAMRLLSSIIIATAPNKTKKRIMVNVAFPAMLKAFVDGGDISESVLKKVKARIRP